MTRTLASGGTRGVSCRAALALVLLSGLLGSSVASSSKKKRTGQPGLAPATRVVPVEELLEYGRVEGSSSSSSSRESGPGGEQPPKPGELYGLTDDDFVYATGTCRERMLLAKSTRAWRRGGRGGARAARLRTETVHVCAHKGKGSAVPCMYLVG